MNKEQLAAQHANSNFKDCAYPNFPALLTDFDARGEAFLAGYEASEKNAEQERIKAKIEVLDDLDVAVILYSLKSFSNEQIDKLSVYLAANNLQIIKTVK